MCVAGACVLVCAGVGRLDETGGESSSEWLAQRRQKSHSLVRPSLLGHRVSGVVFQLHSDPAAAILIDSPHPVKSSSLDEQPMRAPRAPRAPPPRCVKRLRRGDGGGGHAPRAGWLASTARVRFSLARCQIWVGRGRCASVTGLRPRSALGPLLPPPGAVRWRRSATEAAAGGGRCSAAHQADGDAAASTTISMYQHTHTHTARIGRTASAAWSSAADSTVRSILSTRSCRPKHDCEL